MGWMTGTKFLASGEHTKGDRKLVSVAGENTKPLFNKTQGYDVRFNPDTGKYETVEIKKGG